MKILGYCPSSRMALMDEPVAVSEGDVCHLGNQSEPVSLTELGTYYLKCFDVIPATLRSSTPFVQKTFPSGLFEISFRNSVGLTRIGPLPVIVSNRKIAEPQYQAMLDFVVAKVASLIFGFDQPTGQNVKRVQPGKDVAYLEMCFLRMELLQKKPDIDAITGAILADPHRIFQRNHTNRRVEDITVVNPEAWAEMAKRPQGLCRVAEGHPLTDTALGKSLHSASGQWLFPRELVVEEIRQTVDTPENRFIKHFLSMLRDKIQVFQDTLGTRSGGALNQELSEDLEKLEHGLRRFAQAGLWRDVGQMRFFPASSQVLQRREGYRELFRLNALLTLRTQCNFNPPDFACILETKHTPTLYEYWAFFVIKDLFDKRFDLQRFDIVYSNDADPKERRISPGLVLKYKEDVRLYFNRTFSAPDESYSHDLRPDIVIEKGNRRLILDAKFKGSASGSEFYGEADDGTIKRWQDKDIDKMHAYRDAIAGVQGAFILYPGTESKLYSPKDTERSFPGVGALALRPGTDARAVPEHIDTVNRLLTTFLGLAQHDE